MSGWLRRVRELEALPSGDPRSGSTLLLVGIVAALIGCGLALLPGGVGIALLLVGCLLAAVAVRRLLARGHGRQRG